MATTKTTPYKKASSTEYIAWVQRTLNRELGSNLKDDGVITPEYRELVARMQRLHVLGDESGNVDAATQNLMIELSNARSDYIWWIQAALTAAGAWTSGAPTGEFDQRTRDTLLSFQSFNELRDDAWVGPDTETYLIKISGIKPPGAYRFRKPTPKRSKGHVDPLDVTRRTEDWARQFFNDIRKDSTWMSDDPQMRNRILCVLNKLKKADTVSNMNFRYFDTVLALKWARGAFRPGPGGLISDPKASITSLFDRDARDLKKQIEQFVFDSRSAYTFADAYLQFEKKLVYYIRQIDDGLSAIQEIYSGPTYVSNAVVGAMFSWAERKQKDPNDVCSCFR